MTVVRLLAFGALLWLAPPARADFDQIRDLLRRGDFAAAVSASESHLKTAPRDYRVWTLKGIALQSLGRASDGLAALKQALGIEPEFLPALQAAAQIEYQTADPGAAATLHRIVAKRPDPEAFAMLGVLAFERRQCGDSVRYFESATQAMARQPLARWQFATCLFELKRYRDAAREFAAVLAAKEHDAVRYNLGLALYTAGQFAEAAKALEPLSARAAPEADALSLLAAAREASGQTAQAISVLRRALDLHPRDERLYIDLAGLCLEHQSIPLAVEISRIGAGNLPTSARMHTVAGLILMRAGNHEEAESHYKLAAELAPGAGFGAVAQALLLQQMGAADQAVKVLREQRARSTNPQVDLALAQALLQDGAQDPDLSEVEALLAGLAGEHDARVHTLRARLYLKRDQPGKAVTSLEKALAINPNDRTATYQLMTAYARLGRTAEATKLRARVKQLLDDEKRDEAAAGRYRIVQAPSEPR